MDQEQKRPDLPVIFSAGDPAGVGPELLHHMVQEYSASGPSWLIFHSTSDTEKLVNLLEAASGRDVLRLSYEQMEERMDTLQRAMKGPGQVAVVEPTGESVKTGQPGALSGKRAFHALKSSCDWIERNGCYGLVTAPLSKAHVDQAGIAGFTGHTGYLAHRFRSRVVMLMHGQKFSVLPLTVHIPLKEVSSQLRMAVEDPLLIGQIESIMQRPAYKGKKIALCGLNPHSGEDGLLGTEEKEYLDAFSHRLRERGLDIDGPLSADGLFTSDVRAQYRLILACYHDQGLIPFKSLEGMQGINATVGLPFLRTSPDHGTAFSLAGKGIAKPDSMLQSYRTIIMGEL